jgi:pimeloyl-ACP methyl ester carboxylesterase
VAALAAAVLLLATLVLSTNPALADGGHGRRPAPRPLLFVHGGAGSAQQYQTQAKRFASNGYPIDRVAVYEYDSTFSRNTREEIHAGIDRRITELLTATGASQVDLAAHSLGTGIAQAYLATPERAARVAHYVNYDGAAAAAQPGGVPTLAVWGQGPDTRTIVGAQNVRFDQSHTQSVTSSESFATVYEFLTGSRPRTTDIVPTRGSSVRVAGRAAIFPQNYGVAGATLEVYPVSSRSGARLSWRPQARATIGADGSWGPFTLHKGAHYELVLVRAGAPQHHFYPEPFVRDDHLVRLLTSEPGTGVGALVETGDRHSALVVNRNKEWWGDQGAGNDTLEINGQNVINAASAPQAKRAIAVFAFDKGSDGVTDLTAPIADISAQAFLTAVDLYVPAADQTRLPWPWCDDGDRTITLRSVARGGEHRTQFINVPNWRSSAHRISVVFNDYV